MATLKQIEASRRNGTKSKGPVTPEGKTRVSQNGIKHGIYTQTVVLENEDENLYNLWRDNHLAEWAPATDTEHNLVIDIVDARWRLRRLSVLETKALDFEVGRMRSEIDDAFAEIDEGTRTVLGLGSLLSLNRTYEVIQTSIRSQHRIIDRATAQLLKLGKVRQPLNDGGAGTRGLTLAAAPDSVVPVEPANDPAPPQQHQQPSPESADTHPESGEQARRTGPAVSAAPQNPESKPGPVIIRHLAQPRAVFNPALDTRRRVA
jgi:hypothetical protein